MPQAICHATSLIRTDAGYVAAQQCLRKEFSWTELSSRAKLIIH